MVLGCRLFSLRISPVSSPKRPAMALTVSPLTIVYSAGAAGRAGWKAVGMVVETTAAGMTVPADFAAAWAFIAAARLLGMCRAGCGAAAAGWARARDDITTAGSAAVVAAIMGKLGLGGCLGERDIVIGKDPLLNCGCGRGRGCRFNLDTTVT